MRVAYRHLARRMQALWIPGNAMRLIVAGSTALLILASLACYLKPSKPELIENLNDSWVLKENRDGPVIGDLGGVPVSIPQPYAHFVEYEGDPHFMEKRKGPPPPRTYASKLRSFGFDVRFPDMAPLTPETEAQKRSETIYTRTWLRVGIDYQATYAPNGDTSLDRWVGAYIGGKRTFRYERLPNTVYGLIAYTPIRIDDAMRRRPQGTRYFDKDIYFHHDKNGKVDAFIECHNVLHAAAPCKLRFNLLPSMSIDVFVSFRRGLLPHWEEMQSSVSQLIAGFKVPYPPTVAQPKRGN